MCGLEGAFGNTSVVVSDTTDPAFTTTTLTELDQKPDFAWRPGFRIGLDLLYDCFDVELDWTHFNGRANYLNGSQYGNWSLKYDAIDLLLGYYFYPCCDFSIKPFIGLRAARINQNLNSHLETLTVQPSAAPILVTSNFDDEEKFLGLGPQVGVECDWYLGKYFSLYASADFITYFGNTKSERRY